MPHVHFTSPRDSLQRNLSSSTFPCEAWAVATWLKNSMVILENQPVGSEKSTRRFGKVDPSGWKSQPVDFTQVDPSTYPNSTR